MDKEKVQWMDTAAFELLQHSNSSRQMRPSRKNRMSICAGHPERACATRHDAVKASASLDGEVNIPFKGTHC